MSRMIRALVYSPDEIAIVHVTNRTSRRCFLLGNDPLTGKNYDHRKQWLENRLRFQAAWFGIDLLCYAVLSNHFHLILRSRPDVVARWDDTEIARRWLMLCPKRRDANGNAEDPSEFELNAICNDPERLTEIRRRLSDISWWMRLLCQNIAQRSNRDDNETGRFWQGRFKATRILDEVSLLACAVYVDLNPIRAALAQTLEGSDFTSIQKRIEDLKNPAAEASGFLSPVELDHGNVEIDPHAHPDGRRCSNKGFLAMSAAAYAELLDWTARQLRADKRGTTPAGLAPLFQRLGVHEQTWLELVNDFGRLFYVVAGEPRNIELHRPPNGDHRFRVRPAARDLLTSA